MSDTPSWASDIDSCTIQCLTDTIEMAGCSGISDAACYCSENALLAMTLDDGLYLCLGLTCDPYVSGSKNPASLSLLRCGGLERCVG